MKNLKVKDIVNYCAGTLVYGDENVECINFSKDTRTINLVAQREIPMNAQKVLKIKAFQII